MPNLSTEQLNSNLADAAKAYERAMVSVSGPYVRDKFTELADKSLLFGRAAWMPDELPEASLSKHAESDSPMLDGLQVKRLVSPKHEEDIDLLRLGHRSLFAIIDALIERYVKSLEDMEAKRVQMPRVHVKIDAFAVNIFVYGLVCVEPKP